MKFRIILVLTLMTHASQEATSQERCPASETGCTIENAHERIKNRINEGAHRVFNNANPDGRLREVKDTLEECFQCGTDAIVEGIDRFDSAHSND